MVAVDQVLHSLFKESILGHLRWAWATANLAPCPTANPVKNFTSREIYAADRGLSQRQTGRYNTYYINLYSPYTGRKKKTKYHRINLTNNDNSPSRQFTSPRGTFPASESLKNGRLLTRIVTNPRGGNFWKLALSRTPEPNRSTAINFVHVNGR